jgi:hypothetical protein
LLGKPGHVVEFDDCEHVAVDVLAAEGLVPPLRLVPGRSATRRDIA